MDTASHKSLVKDVQIANKVKSKLKKLLVQLDQSKQGFVQIEAFFQMLELHEINLNQQEKLKLKKLCETKSNQIKYKDALALIHVNKDVNDDVSPIRQGSAFWILQVPRRKDVNINLSKSPSQIDRLSNFDARSIVSNSSNYTDVTIDPIIRLKAEKILEGQREKGNQSQLEVIKEENQLHQHGEATQKLTEDILRTLDSKDDRKSDLRSQLSKIKSNATISKFKNFSPDKRRDLSQPGFQESSTVDQDDSYGNYRPGFLTKNHRVTGRTQAIIQLQRQASLDNSRALLGPVQPDLTQEKVTQRKMYADNPHNALVNHINHDSEIKVHYKADGSPVPPQMQQDHFFRKAIDHYTHDSIPDGKINDPQHYRMKLAMEENKQVNDLQTKGKVSADYLRSVIDQKNVTESRIQLLVQFIEEKVDHRTLLKLKQHIFNLHPNSDEISIEEWKKESHKFMNYYPSEIEEKLLEDITVDGKVSKQKFIELMDTFQFLPIKIKRDKNKSEQVYFVLNSNKRGAFQSKEEILANLKQDNDRKHISKIMVLMAIKIEEKYHNLSKAFLSFDLDGDQGIQKNEFHKGIETLRVKLPKSDIDKVFEFMDTDCDGRLSYHEFCGFAEEKRRNIDPFDSLDNQQRLAQSMGLTNESLKALQKTPYQNLGGKMSNSELHSKSSSSYLRYEDLESQAQLMMIINNGQLNKVRKGTIPNSVKKNKEFTFGMRSDVVPGQQALQETPGKYLSNCAGSSMGAIITHSDNLKDSLHKKINLKMQLEGHKGKYASQQKIKGTRASELRSHSVMTNKTLAELDDSLNHAKMLKGVRNDSSFLELEREKAKITKVFQLPPIERMQSLQKSLNQKSQKSIINNDALLDSAKKNFEFNTNRFIPVLSTTKKQLTKLMD